MVMLRDVDIANLVALGGWLRAFEIATLTTSINYSEAKASKLSRTDVIAYFLETLQGLEPKLRQRAHIVNLTKALESLLAELGGHEPESENKDQDQPQPKILTQEETLSLSKISRQMMEIIETGK